MASVYILSTIKLGKYYIGSCCDLKQRLSDHKDRTYKDSFTTTADDWELYFEIGDLEGKNARKIENHIKSMKSKKYIENLKKYPEISQKLLTRFSDKSENEKLH
jgi:putative endonuclease